MYDYVNNSLQDGFTWYCNNIIAETKGDKHKMGQALDELYLFLSGVNSEYLRNIYIEKVAESFDTTKKIVEGAVKVKIKVEQEKKEKKADGYEEEQLPSWAVKDDIMKYGFTERILKDNTGYYFSAGSGSLIQRTNFVIKPLYHIYSQNKEDNRRMIAVNNGYEERIIEIPSKGMLSKEKLS